MVRKKFFKERTPEEIKNLGPRDVYTQSKLVEKIEELDPEDAQVWRFRLTPGKFFRRNGDSVEASRKNLKHGNYIRLDQPSNLQEALEGEIPLQYRMKTFRRELRGVPQEEIDAVGFSFRPVVGRDKRERRIPFYVTPEGVRIFTYSENIDKEGALADAGIKIMPYDDAERVWREGGKIVCKIPSREKGQRRYQLRFDNFPLKETQNKNKNPRAVIWGLKAEYVIMPKHKFWTFGYTRPDERRTSDFIMMQPQEVAAYTGAAGEYLRKEGNWTPMKMNPFPSPSERQARFYRKLRNNVLVYDPSLSRGDKLRKLHLDEVSIMLARQVSVAGHHQTMFWDFSDRDPKLKDYGWGIPNSEN